MYSNWFRLKWNIWNNSFSYDIRKQNNSEPQIYVSNLIQWTIEDIKLGDQIVFEEVDSKWQIQSFTWLKNFVKLNHCHSDLSDESEYNEESRINDTNKNLNVSPCSTWQSIPIYIFDNHNHALFFRYQELFNWNIEKWIKLIHIDQHTDMNEAPLIRGDKGVLSYDLKDIYHFTNYQCNVWNFIQPAIQDWLISQVLQINTEYKLLDVSTLQRFNVSTFILDIDLDFRHPQMSIENYQQTIQITKNLISQASLVTIATSPYFLDQTLAIKILKDIFN